MIKILRSNMSVRLILLRRYILGIETSCDDTGAAIVDLKGNLISEHLESQIRVTSALGGVVPKVAAELHKVSIEPCVSNVLNGGNISFSDISAIAVTVKPGLSFSLGVGRDYAVAKAIKYNIPIIPIHHMEAHALTVRMFDENIDFPFIVLLVSGGNSILAVAHNVEEFSLLGTKLDISPGDCLDKIARMLNLIGKDGSHNKIPGGRAIELLAMENKKDLISFNSCRPHRRDCDFSFSGLETAVLTHVNNLIKNEETPDLSQICASVLYSMSTQICSNIQRSISYCHHYLDKAPNTLVVSGGVASNLYFRECFQQVCDYYEYRLICPPVKYCTDNGVMIAWNGFELFRLGKRIVQDVSSIDYCARVPFGVDIRDLIIKRYIKVPKLNIKKLK